MPKFMLLITAAFLAVSCTHKVAVDDINITSRTIASPGSFDQRRTIASETCEAQYSPGRQNYLAAVEARIGAGGSPDTTKAPLDAFRAEINAAYNAVVANCKTHMNCLEVQNYEEAKCYMAANDRKDAERRFADLAEDLRRLERKRNYNGGTGRRSPSVNVTNNNSVTQKNEQTQSNDAQTGPRIEDQDVLVVCGHAKNLLKARCRQPCDTCED